ncbi:unnamed protein product [Adineta ricciae]|uniref:HAT C-terminal dimerisation domain-containing protein n=1 Tax=Adineta ricciae TaxID=249248 RepID=A0A815T048_ADIRI|nr:unnamed protein product [Adineta ricciae]
MEELKSVDTLSVTTDLWSDRQLNSYLCLTGHYLNSQSKLDAQVLSFSTFAERHTSEAISRTIKTELKRLQVYEKVHTITCDGASNVRKSFQTLKPKRIHCLAHKLHLTVCNALCLWVNQNASSSATNDEEDERTDSRNSTSTTNNQSNTTFEMATESEEAIAVADDDNHNVEEEEEEENSSDNNNDDDDDNGDVEGNGEDSSYDYSSMEENFDTHADPNATPDAVHDNWEEGVVVDRSSIACIEQYTISQAIQKCRGLVKTINKSSILSSFVSYYKTKTNVKNSLIIDCKSRWSSTHRLIQSILLHKQIIGRQYAEKYDLNLTNKQLTKLSKFELNRQEWEILDQTEKILLSFAEATAMISGKTYSTIGLGYLAITSIKETLEERTGNREADQLKSLLYDQLTHYFENDSDQYELLKHHAFFDPLGYGILDRRDRTKIEREIRDLHKEQTLSTANTTSSNVVSTPTPIRRAKPTSLQRFLATVGKNQSYTNKEDTTLSITNELSTYRILALEEFSEVISEQKEYDPFMFWRLHETKLKFLSNLARKYLIVPCTSVLSESTFSIASYIGRKERNRLTPENLCILVFLKDKMDEQMT